MVRVRNVSKLGDAMLVILDNGSRTVCQPTGGQIWTASRNNPPPPPPPDPVDPTTPVIPPVVVPPTPENPGGSGEIYNPWASMRITGDWNNHASYSAGGTDYPHGMGTLLAMPAAGTLHPGTWTDAAGRRQVLELDRSFDRHSPANPTRMARGYREAAGPMRAIVFQHLSAFGTPGHYGRGETTGMKSGASADPSRGEYGGDVHLHIHGLDSYDFGNRLNIVSFW